MKDSFRKMVKQILANLIFYSGLLNLYLYLRRRLSSRPDFTILMYHQVLDVKHNGENYLPSGMVTLENTFDKQMKYLREHSNVITLDKLIACLKDKEHLPPGSVVITFDDGWRDNYVFALPILKKYDLPAAVFLSTDYIGTSRMLWFQVVNFIIQAQALTSQKMIEILNRFGQISLKEKRAIVESLAYPDAFIDKLKKIGPQIQENIIVEMMSGSDIQMSQINKRRMMLNWDEVREMGENRISFGSHAQSHRILTHLDLGEAKKELTESKRTIEEKTKRPVSFFAYPNGDYTSRIKELVKETGYLCACTVEGTGKKQDAMDLFALPRMGIHEGMSIGIRGGFSKALFACHIAGFLIRGRRKYERSVGD
jgi:peptidoglycan/xylan/chitin deacetylase (PgdA/CDA1 family)